MAWQPGVSPPASEPTHGRRSPPTAGRCVLVLERRSGQLDGVDLVQVAPPSVVENISAPVTIRDSDAARDELCIGRVGRSGGQRRKGGVRESVPVRALVASD